MASPDTPQPIRIVGFVGLGDQGDPMTRAIAEAGFGMHLWARRPPALEALAGVEYVVHSSVAELAGVCELR